MESITRVQIQVESVCVTLRADADGKNMNPYVLSAMGKK